MGATIVPLLTTIHDCDSVADWTGTPTLDSEVFIQGTGSLSKKVSKTTSTHMKPITATGLSDTIIYIWILGGSISQFDTKANGGIRIRVEDAALNWGEWYIAGKDVGYEGGWQCLAVRTTTAFDDKSATAPDMTAITAVGVVFSVTISAAKINCWWDAVRYGTGLRIKAGTEAEPGTFADVIAAEKTAANQWGIVVESEGVLMVQGQLIFGSLTAGETTYFKDISKILVFRDRPFGVFYEIKIEGNATATTKVFFGAKSGERGISGCVFSCAGDSKYKITATDVNITELGFYGCSFLDADTISLPAYAVGKEVLSCNFEACAKVLTDTCIVKYCTFISADNIAIEISSVDHNITDCNFINNPRAVEITVAVTIEYKRLIFSGNTYVTFNSSGSPINVNLTDSEADTWNYDPAGSVVNYILTVLLKVTVKDIAGSPIQGARVYIEKEAGGVLMNELTLADGTAEESTDYLGNIIVRIRKSSPPETRYIPIDTIGTVTSDGYTLIAVMYEDAIA